MPPPDFDDAVFPDTVLFVIVIRPDSNGDAASSST